MTHLQDWASADRDFLGASTVDFWDGSGGGWKEGKVEVGSGRRRGRVVKEETEEAEEVEEVGKWRIGGKRGGDMGEGKWGMVEGRVMSRGHEEKGR